MLLVRHWCQFFTCAIMLCWSMAAWAEIDRTLLVGDWCLVDQSMLGYRFESSPPKVIRDNLKTKVGQRYQFIDNHTVDIQMNDKTSARFTYKISGKKQNRIRIKKWESFAVTSLTDSEMVAKALGTVNHRFIHGTCAEP